MTLLKPCHLAPFAALVLALALAGCDFPTGIDIPVLTDGGMAGGQVTGGATPPTSSGPIPTDAKGAEAAVRPIAEREAGLQGVPAHLVMAVISQESGFRASAVSPVGAQGLMQLMPATVQDINKAGAVTVLDPFDAAQNVAGGTWYLKWVKQQLPAAKVVAGEEWKLALGGYNGGIGRVRSAIDKALAGAPRHPKVTWTDVAPSMPTETQRYVPSVVAKWTAYGLD